MFICHHCGKCCSDLIVQINLSFGDLVRLSAGSKKSVAGLFEEGIVGFNPFFNPETERYDIELGLNKPCRLRLGERCFVYTARPLNCRIFPHWLLASNSEIPGFKCAEGPSDRKASKEYADAIGEILLSESEKSDCIMSELKSKLSVPDLDLGEPSMEAGIEAGRLAIASSIISKMGLARLRERVIAAVVQSSGWATLEQLESFERLLTKKN